MRRVTGYVGTGGAVFAGGLGAWLGWYARRRGPSAAPAPARQFRSR
ncbi:hypothetical protein J0H58_21020 [bacterium]|nr:hypothetical protein [bacterium]